MKILAGLLIIILSQIAVFGQTIEGFTLPNAVDGTNLSLSEYKAAKAVVIIFNSGKCAYGNHYIQRIISFKDEFSPKGVKFIMINSNSSDFVSEESVLEMKKFIEKHHLDIPYLADKDKKAKNMLKATRTPEVFVLKAEQDQFKIKYKGAIDDNPQSASDVDHAYLQDALVNLLKNSAIEVKESRPVGCLIK